MSSPVAAAKSTAIRLWCTRTTNVDATNHVGVVHVVVGAVGTVMRTTTVPASLLLLTNVAGARECLVAGTPAARRCVLVCKMGVLGTGFLSCQQVFDARLTHLAKVADLHDGRQGRHVHL